MGLYKDLSQVGVLAGGSRSVRNGQELNFLRRDVLAVSIKYLFRDSVKRMF